MGYHGVETTELVFENHRVPAANLLGEEGQGFLQIMDAIEVGRVNVAARAVGLATRAFEEAIRYAQEREAFGKPIAQHQMIQEKLAHMGTLLEASKLMLMNAAKKKSAGERSDLEAGMAKYFCTEACHEIVTEALRVHGGYGYQRRVHDRTAVPRRAVPADRRGDERDPEARDQPAAARALQGDLSPGRRGQIWAVAVMRSSSCCGLHPFVPGFGVDSNSYVPLSPVARQTPATSSRIVDLQRDRLAVVRGAVAAVEGAVEVLDVRPVRSGLELVLADAGAVFPDQGERAAGGGLALRKERQHTGDVLPRSLSPMFCALTTWNDESHVPTTAASATGGVGAPAGRGSG